MSNFLDVNGVSKVYNKLKGYIDKLNSKFLPLTGGSMANTNKVTNLNADLLDGYDVGNVNGQIPYLVEFPGSQKLVNLGYNTQEFVNSDEAYIKGICKWCYDTYKGKGIQTLIGAATPNSSSTMIIHLYGNHGADENGYPNYCSGLYQKLNSSGILKIFTFVVGEWSFREINAYSINNAIAQLPNKANSADVYTKKQINDKNFATKTEVDERIQNIIGAAPADLDTLEEIAEKLQDGDDIHTALVQSISEKAPKSEVDALKTLTANYCFNGIILYSQVDNAKNNGYYLIQDNGGYNGGTAVYDLLLVFKNTETNIRQTWFRVSHSEGKFFIQSRYTNNLGEWNDWSIDKLDGSDIVDKSISHTKLIEGANSGLDADKLDGYHASTTPAANKIPIADSNGMLPVNGIKNTIKHSIKGIGWYRIAAVNSYCDSIYLNINREWNHGYPESYQFAINITTENKVTITQLSGNYNSYQYIDKIRVLTKNGSNYIDIHYNATTDNNICIFTIGTYITLPVPVISNDIPSGYTATEFETTNGFKASKINNTTNRYELSLNVNKIAKITNITGGILVSLTGTNTNRASLVYISSYNNGTSLRTTCRMIYNNDNYYKFYINEASENSASVYIERLVDTGLDSLNVISLTEDPCEVSLIDALPSDVTSLDIKSNNLVTDSDKFEQLTPLNSEYNIDTIQTSGTYVINRSDNNNNYRVCLLQVFNANSYVRQTFWDLITGNIKIRNKSLSSNSNWSNWNTLYNLNTADTLTTKQLTNEDLNNFKALNFSSYYAEADNTCTNKPTGITSFSLTVHRNSQNAYIQILTDINTESIYKRMFNPVTKVWSPWKRMLTEDDLQKTWTGTEAEYTALSTKDANTIYYIKE